MKERGGEVGFNPSVDVHIHLRLRFFHMRHGKNREVESHIAPTFGCCLLLLSVDALVVDQVENWNRIVSYFVSCLASLKLCFDHLISPALARFPFG